MNPTLAYRQEKLTPRQIEKAALADPRLYPQHMPCVRCKRAWMQHKGLLCPIVDGHMSQIRDRSGRPYIVPPTFGDQLFVPDEDYFKKPEGEWV